MKSVKAPLNPPEALVESLSRCEAKQVCQVDQNKLDLLILYATYLKVVLGRIARTLRDNETTYHQQCRGTWWQRLPRQWGGLKGVVCRYVDIKNHLLSLGQKIQRYYQVLRDIEKKAAVSSFKDYVYPFGITQPRYDYHAFIRDWYPILGAYRIPHDPYNVPLSVIKLHQVFSAKIQEMGRPIGPIEILKRERRTLTDYQEYLFLKYHEIMCCFLDARERAKQGISQLAKKTFWAKLTYVSVETQHRDFHRAMHYLVNLQGKAAWNLYVLSQLLQDELEIPQFYYDKTQTWEVTKLCYVHPPERCIPGKLAVTYFMRETNDWGSDYGYMPESMEWHL